MLSTTIRLVRVTDHVPGDPFPTCLVDDDTVGPASQIANWQVRDHTALLLTAIGEADHAATVSALDPITEHHLHRPGHLRRYVTALAPIAAAMDHRLGALPVAGGHLATPEAWWPLDAITLNVRRDLSALGSRVGALAWHITHTAMAIAIRDTRLNADAIAAAARQAFDDTNAAMRCAHGHQIAITPDDKEL